ncbi:MAG TPA: POTRA domain-containing protein [Candidatus Binatia bacterium]|nr:POTRA domain-containing protein [Candidatus Binatia bacterium]
MRRVHDIEHPGALRHAWLPLALAASSVMAQAPGTLADPRLPLPEVAPARTAVIQLPAPPAAEPQAAGRSLTVDRVVFDGNTVFTAGQLAGVVAPYLHRPVTPLELAEAAERVTDFYVQHGYTLASAMVSSQKPSGGVVHIGVREGRVASVTVQGTRRYSTQDVEANLGRAGAGQFHRGSDLESGLRQLNRLPGLSAKAVVQPVGADGTTGLLIDARERPLDVTLTADNHARASLGRERMTLDAVLNTPLRLGDRLHVVATGSRDDRLRYGEVAYDAPLWTQGPRVGIAIADARLDATAGAGVTVPAENRLGRVQLGQVLRDTRQDLVIASVGASHSVAEADLAGNAIPRSRLMLAELSAMVTRTYGSLAATQAALALQSNFHKPGVTGCAAGGRCEEVGLRAELDLQHLQPIWARFDGYARVDGVWSEDPLPEVLQFTLGGPASVRAFQAADVRGDRGIFTSAGMREAFTVGGAIVHGRVFFDRGHGECLRIRPACTVAHDALTGYGVGLDARWPLSAMTLSGKADVSLPAGHRDLGNDARVFASVAVGWPGQ